MTPSFQDDLLEQPQALQRTLDGLRISQPLTAFAQALSRGQYRRIVVTGMGSSLCAAQPLILRLISQGLHAQSIETSELIHHATALIEPRTLIVAISQSGESVEVVQLVELAKNKATILGVTNSPESPLAREAAAAILTRAGQETSVSCKTYVATLAALCWLGDQFSDGGQARQFPQLAGVPDCVALYLSRHQDHVAQLTQVLDGINYLILTGRGISLAAAQDGALIIKESARFPAEGMSAAGFRHGPLEIISPHVLVVMYAGLGETAQLNLKLAQDVNEWGGRAEVVQARENKGPFDLPSSTPASLPILEILPAQMIALALAARQGFEAGRFVHIGKITRTE